MTILNSSVGALRLSLAKGETLIVRNYSGTETVTGSTVSREDASSTLGAGAVVYGPQSVAASIVLSTTGTLDYQTVMGDPTPAPASVGVIGFSVIPPTRDSLGIEVAVSACVAAGGGTVVYEAADYTITADHTLVSNVSHIGVPGRLTFSGDIPDADYASSGGTRFLLDAGVTGFKFNNTALGSVSSTIAETALSGVEIAGITFVGGLRAIHIGAYLNMGAVWSKFHDLHAFDQTGDWAFDFVNFQHSKFERIYAATQLTAGSGVRFGAALPSTGADTLLPGNSEIGEIYTYCKNRRNRSIMFEAFGPSAGCVLNQVKVFGRLQGNRYGAASPDDIGMSFTSGSANIVVADNAQFANMVVDMPVAFTADTAGFAKTTVYFVRTRDAGTNTITLAESMYATSSINATATTTGTAKCGGFPSLEFVGRAGNAVKNTDFGQLDAEAFGNVCALNFQKTRNCVGFMSEVMTSATGTALVSRDAEIGITYAGTTTLTQDESTLFHLSNCTNLAGGPFVYSGGSFTLDSAWNSRDVRYTGTSNITITVPNNLPKGFEFSITPTSGLTRNVTTSSGSTTATTTDTTGFVVGASIRGNTNIPANAKVASITNSTTFELTVAASASGTVSSSIGQGIVTFDYQSGGAIFSTSGLRTNGQYATARLENIANRVFRLTGDLQV